MPLVLRDFGVQLVGVFLGDEVVDAQGVVRPSAELVGAGHGEVVDEPLFVPWGVGREGFDFLEEVECGVGVAAGVDVADAEVVCYVGVVGVRLVQWAQEPDGGAVVGSFSEVDCQVERLSFGFCKLGGLREGACGEYECGQSGGEEVDIA